MRAAFWAVWAVLLSAGIVQTANGLQTDLIGVRATLEAFPPWTIGFIMAAYYCGYASGPLLSHGIIARFGHVRTVMVSVLVAACVIVLQALFVTPFVWAALRLLCGLALSMTYVSFESWINERAENRVRGRMFSLYLVMQMIGMTGSQGLLSIGDPKNTHLFLLAASLFVIGGVPIWIARHRAPANPPPSPLNMVALFHVSPLGALITSLSGVSWAIVAAFGPVYAQRAGFSLSAIGLFMGVAMVTGALAQFPLGWLSDAIGRRATIALMTAAGLAAALFGLWGNGRGVIYGYIAMAAIGVSVFPLYGISVAHTNDRVAPERRVASAAGLVLLFGLGSIFGPLLAGGAVSAIGAGGFFASLAVTMALSVAVTAAAR
jgi:MFS family permease